MTCQGLSCYRADIAYELLSNLGFFQWLVLSKHEGGSWTLITQMGLTWLHWPTPSQWSCASHKLINMSRFRISADFHDPSCMSPRLTSRWLCAVLDVLGIYSCTLIGYMKSIFDTYWRYCTVVCRAQQLRLWPLLTGHVIMYNKHLYKLQKFFVNLLV